MIDGLIDQLVVFNELSRAELSELQVETESHKPCPVFRKPSGKGGLITRLDDLQLGPAN